MLSVSLRARGAALGPCPRWGLAQAELLSSHQQLEGTEAPARQVLPLSLASICPRTQTPLPLLFAAPQHPPFCGTDLGLAAPADTSRQLWGWERVCTSPCHPVSRHSLRPPPLATRSQRCPWDGTRVAQWQQVTAHGVHLRCFADRDLNTGHELLGRSLRLEFKLRKRELGEIAHPAEDRKINALYRTGAATQRAASAALTT